MMGKTTRAAIELSLHWKSFSGVHTDRYYAENIDFWRDLFPGNLKDGLTSLHRGDHYCEKFLPGSLVPPHSDRNIKQFNLDLFNPDKKHRVIKPVTGRYYPKGCCWRPLNSFPVDTSPIRVIDVSASSVTVDMNHPLSQFPLTIVSSAPQSTASVAQRGGAARDIGDLLTADGPGMQVPHPSVSKHSHHIYPLARLDNQDDRKFYQSARMVHHLDETARAHVRALYSRLLKPGATILDLMASWYSHLEDRSRYKEISGLGLNEEELQYNELLSDYVIQDLNKQQKLPYATNKFDAVICTVSVEYLCSPYEIFAELARIIRPGGLLIITISERWFPGKAIKSWEDLHPFERQGLVIQYFQHDNHFTNIHTESIRGYPRPSADPYHHRLSSSDSLYFVWGSVPI